MSPSSNLDRLGGLAAMLGGALLVVVAGVIASMPRGCIGLECPFSEMRDTGVAGLSLMPALVLIAAGAAGLAARTRRSSGRFGRLGSVGLTAAVGGIVLLVIGGLIQSVFQIFSDDFPLMPVFVFPGVLALVAGFVLLGISVVRASVLPRWAGVLLVVGALTILFFNDQNAQALMAMPFGVAWVAVG